MSSSLENSKAIVVEYLDRFWAKGDVSVVDELCHTDFALQYPLTGLVTGRNDVKGMMTGVRLSFPDLCFKQVGPVYGETTADGDFVFTRIAGGGTHTGPAVQLAVGAIERDNTGKRMDITGMVIFKVVGGQLIDETGEEGAIDAVRQLGI